MDDKKDEFKGMKLKEIIDNFGQDYVKQKVLNEARTSFEDLIQLECLECHKKHAPVQCSKCKLAVYCNRDCQLKNWKKEHKLACGYVVNAMKELESQFDKLDTFISNYELHQDEPCCICFEKKDSLLDLLQLPCHHIYCIDCISRAEKERVKFQFTCPLCRKEMDQNLVTYTEWAIEELILQSDYYEYYDPLLAQSYTEKARVEYRRLENLVSRYETWQQKYLPFLRLYHLRLLLLEKQYDQVFILAKELKDSTTLKRHKIKILEVYYCVGVAFEATEKYDKAISAFAQAARFIDDNEFKSLHRKIYNHMAASAYKKGEEHMLFMAAVKAIESNENFDTIYELMSKYYCDKQDWEKARLCLKAAIIFECPWKPAHKEMMKLKLRQFDEERARSTEASEKQEEGK